MSQPCGAQHDTRAVCVQAVISKRELTPTSGVYQAVYPLLMRRPAPAGRAAAARARGRARKARRRLGGRRVSARARPRAERLARGGPALRSPGRRPPYIRPALYEAARPRGARRGFSRARPRPRHQAAAWGHARARTGAAGLARPWRPPGRRPPRSRRPAPAGRVAAAAARGRAHAARRRLGGRRMHARVRASAAVLARRVPGLCPPYTRKAASPPGRAAAAGH